MSDTEQKIEEATSSNEVTPKEPDSSVEIESKPSVMDVNSTEDEVSSSVKGTKRPFNEAVIEISDDESDGSSVCAVDSYQASAAEAKRLRGDFSSSDSYSSSDEDDSPFEDDSIVIDFKEKCSNITSKALNLNPRAQRTEDPKLNPEYVSEELIDNVKQCWHDKTEYKNSNLELIVDPFRLVVLDNFLTNKDIINNIVDDMNTLEWNKKKMDLYEFHQTTDLANLSWQRSIRGIYELLKGDILKLVSKVTGLNLTHVSASCSLYGPADHLLVHDDMLGDRRVAFILYLSPWTIEKNNQQESKHSGWCESMGGALELFGMDENGHPTEAVRKLLPYNNRFSFFKVDVHTFHQVSEVTSFELPRLSINGWFHGPDVPPDCTSIKRNAITEVVTHKPHSEVVLMNSWLESTYQIPRTRLQIQRQIEKSSEICLEQFFQQSKYDAVLEVLRIDESLWVPRGPPDQRQYDAINLTKVDTLEREHPLRELVKILTSNNFFKFLTDCTELNVKCYFNLEVQRWTANSFTLLPPKEQYSANELDITMYLDYPSTPIKGGTTTYIAPEEANTEPLITLTHKNNALNMVYSDEGTAKFTSYVSKLSFSNQYYFYIVTCSYKE